jgi:hypothetical protein
MQILGAEMALTEALESKDAGAAITARQEAMLAAQQATDVLHHLSDLVLKERSPVLVFAKIEDVRNAVDAKMIRPIHSRSRIQAFRQGRNAFCKQIGRSPTSMGRHRLTRLLGLRSEISDLLRSSPPRRAQRRGGNRIQLPWKPVVGGLKDDAIGFLGVLRRNEIVEHILEHLLGGAI